MLPGMHLPVTASQLGLGDGGSASAKERCAAQAPSLAQATATVAAVYGAQLWPIKQKGQNNGQREDAVSLDGAPPGNAARSLTSDSIHQLWSWPTCPARDPWGETLIAPQKLARFIHKLALAQRSPVAKLSQPLYLQQPAWPGANRQSFPG